MLFPPFCRLIKAIDKNKVVFHIYSNDDKYFVQKRISEPSFLYEKGKKDIKSRQNNMERWLRLFFSHVRV